MTGSATPLFESDTPQSLDEISCALSNNAIVARDATVQPGGALLMKLHVLGLALFSAVAIVASIPAQAQNGTLTRSFVSSSGADTNACTITAPCATFAQAYTKVGAKGIIAALDPGKYGSLTIIGPVTVNGNGWSAITGLSGNNAINITATSGTVTLTGLELDGAGNGNNGIYLTSALSGNATLNIRDC